MSFLVQVTRTLLKNIILYFWNLSPALSEDVVAHRCSTHFFTVKEASPSNRSNLLLLFFRLGKLPFWLHLLYYLYFALFILRQLVILYLLAFSEDETYSTSAGALAAYQRYDSSAWVVIRLVGYSHALALLTLLPFPLFALYLHYMFSAKRYNANFRISHSLAFLNKKCFFVAQSAAEVAPAAGRSNWISSAALPADWLAGQSHRRQRAGQGEIFRLSRRRGTSLCPLSPDYAGAHSGGLLVAASADDSRSGGVLLR